MLKTQSAKWNADIVMEKRD